MALLKPTNGSNADYAARIGLLFDAFNNGNYNFSVNSYPGAITPGSNVSGVALGFVHFF